MNASFESIDASIQSLDWKRFNHNTFVSLTTAERVRQAVKMYRALRPLFVFASTFPAIPLSWRTGVQLFMATLDALAAETGVTPDFKAGKDL